MKQGDKQHIAFIKYGESMGLDMEMHPLHLLYLNPNTANHLESFKAGWNAAIDAAALAVEVADHSDDDSGHGANCNAMTAVEKLKE